MGRELSLLIISLETLTRHASPASGRLTLRRTRSAITMHLLVVVHPLVRRDLFSGMVVNR